MKNSAFFTIVGALTLGACASPQPGSPAFTVQQEQKKQEARTETVKTTANDLPSWYVTLPIDEFSIYAAGNGTSADLQFAEDKAVLGAKRALADRIKGILSSKMKQIVSESGADETSQLIQNGEQTTTNLITEVNLAGYNITEKKFVPVGTQYRAYVLMQYPLGNANRILVDQINKNSLLESKLRASKAFLELERDIQSARKNSNGVKAEGGKDNLQQVE